jgi:hypothetical protein
MSKEIKPIFVVRVPMYYKNRDINQINYELGEKLKSYYIITVQSEVEEVEFECYNLQEAELIDLDELRKIVKKDE